MNGFEDARKERIARAFSSRAGGYDSAADVQWMVAGRLSDRILRNSYPAKPRILEIGCGTGFLSARLAEAFPESDMLLTDIAASMLERARGRIGTRPRYRVLDGENPEGLDEQFDLIVSNLAFQWFVDLGLGISRLAGLLAPGGRLIFSTLGRETFREWREAHKALGLACGTPAYPDAASFVWPENHPHRLEEERILQPYHDGHDFVRSLKALGAGEPAPGHRPLSPGAFRRLLAGLENGFEATYHILYGEVSA